jgi:hypothetical protein
MGQFRSDIMSIISTRIRRTIGLIISFASPAPTIFRFTWSGERTLPGQSWKNSVRRLPRGIPVQQGANGTPNIIRRSVISFMRRLILFVENVGLALCETSGLSFAQMHVSRAFDVDQERITRQGIVWCAAIHSRSTDIPKQKAALASVGRWRVREPGLACLSVEPIGREDVYCLTVPDTGNFMLANGVIVANCADESRYAAMSRPWTRMPEVPKPIRGADKMTLGEAWRLARPRSQSMGRIE